MKKQILSFLPSMKTWVLSFLLLTFFSNAYSMEQESEKVDEGPEYRTAQNVNKITSGLVRVYNDIQFLAQKQDLAYEPCPHMEENEITRKCCREAIEEQLFQVKSGLRYLDSTISVMRKVLPLARTVKHALEILDKDVDDLLHMVRQSYPEKKLTYTVAQIMSNTNLLFELIEPDNIVKSVSTNKFPLRHDYRMALSAIYQAQHERDVSRALVKYIHTITNGLNSFDEVSRWEDFSNIFLFLLKDSDVKKEIFKLFHEDISLGHCLGIVRDAAINKVVGIAPKVMDGMGRSENLKKILNKFGYEGRFDEIKLLLDNGETLRIVLKICGSLPLQEKRALKSILKNYGIWVDLALKYLNKGLILGRKSAQCIDGIATRLSEDAQFDRGESQMLSYMKIVCAHYKEKQAMLLDCMKNAPEVSWAEHWLPFQGHSYKKLDPYQIIYKDLCYFSIEELTKVASALDMQRQDIRLHLDEVGQKEHEFSQEKEAMLDEEKRKIFEIKVKSKLIISLQNKDQFFDFGCALELERQQKQLEQLEANLLMLREHLVRINFSTHENSELKDTLEEELRIADRKYSRCSEILQIKIDRFRNTSSMEC